MTIPQVNAQRVAELVVLEAVFLWAARLLAGAFLGAFSFALWFHLDWKQAMLGGLCGALTWFVVFGAVRLGYGEFFAFLAGSVTAGLLAEILARARKCPVTVYLVAGIIPPPLALFPTNSQF